MRGPSAPSFSPGDLAIVSVITEENYNKWYSRGGNRFMPLPQSHIDKFSGKVCRICIPLENVLGDGWYVHVDPDLPDYAPGGLRLPVEWLKLVFES